MCCGINWHLKFLRSNRMRLRPREVYYRANKPSQGQWWLLTSSQTLQGSIRAPYDGLCCALCVYAIPKQIIYPPYAPGNTTVVDPTFTTPHLDLQRASHQAEVTVTLTHHFLGMYVSTKSPLSFCMFSSLEQRGHLRTAHAQLRQGHTHQLQLPHDEKCCLVHETTSTLCW